MLTGDPRLAILVKNQSEICIPQSAFTKAPRKHAAVELLLRARRPSSRAARPISSGGRYHDEPGNGEVAIQGQGLADAALRHDGETDRIGDREVVLDRKSGG